MKLRPGMRKKENGSIEFRFTVNGKRYSVTGASVPDCIKKQAELIEKAAQFTSNNKAITLDQYFDHWVRERALHNRKSTIINYEAQYKSHIKGTSLGKTKLCEISRSQIKDFRMTVMPAVRSKEFSIKLANSVTSFLSTILSSAASDGIIANNPAYKIESITDENQDISERKKPARETIHRALSIPETKEFLKAAEDSWYIEIFKFLLSTGMRVGEACALTWKDIDRSSNVIHITKTISGQTAHTLMETPPKTDAGARDIPLTAATMKILSDQKKKLAKFGFSDIGNHIFLNTKGGQLLDYSVYNAIKKALRKTSIDHFSTHCFRDTFATRYLEQGGNMNTLKVILGHSSLSMTMDLYAHVMPDTKADEMSRMSFIG